MADGKQDPCRRGNRIEQQAGDGWPCQVRHADRRHKQVRQWANKQGRCQRPTGLTNGTPGARCSEQELDWWKSAVNALKLNYSARWRVGAKFLGTGTVVWIRQEEIVSIRKTNQLGALLDQNTTHIVTVCWLILFLRSKITNYVLYSLSSWNRIFCTFSAWNAITLSLVHSELLKETFRNGPRTFSENSFIWAKRVLKQRQWLLEPSEWTACELKFIANKVY